MKKQVERQVVLDTETTGLSSDKGHRVIEIGCLELVQREVTGKTFRYYLDPERDVEAGAKAVHGITEKMLAGKPKFADVVDEFLAFVDGAQLIIHNAPFDVGFLNAELKRLPVRYKSIDFYCPILDTLPLARRMHPGQKNTLDALCKRYHVNNANRQFHGALLDSELLAYVYLSMTGGQASLFDKKSDNTTRQATQTTQSTDKATKTWNNLPETKSTKAELQAHQAFVQANIKHSD